MMHKLIDDIIPRFLIIMTFFYYILFGIPVIIIFLEYQISKNEELNKTYEDLNSFQIDPETDDIIFKKKD